MENFRKLLKDYEKLAKQWRAFSRETNGWNCKTYKDKDTGLEVWCYFADKKDHSSIKFSNYPVQLYIDFFAKPIFGDMTLKAIDKLPALLQQFRIMLAKEKQVAEEKLVGIEEVKN